MIVKFKYIYILLRKICLFYKYFRIKNSGKLEKIFNMKKSVFLVFIIISVLNSCVAYSQEKVDKKLLSKIENKNYDSIVGLNKLYISKGHFECTNDFIIKNKLASTSDGIYDTFLFIKNDGKMYFNTLPASNTPLKDLYLENDSTPNAIFYQKNEKFITERKSVTHAILGVGGGYLISKGEIKFKLDSIIIRDNSDKLHCDVYTGVKK